MSMDPQDKRPGTPDDHPLIDNMFFQIIETIWKDAEALEPNKLPRVDGGVWVTGDGLMKVIAGSPEQLEQLTEYLSWFLGMVKQKARLDLRDMAMSGVSPAQGVIELMDNLVVQETQGILLGFIAGQRFEWKRQREQHKRAAE